MLPEPAPAIALSARSPKNQVAIPAQPRGIAFVEPKRLKHRADNLYGEMGWFNHVGSHQIIRYNFVLSLAAIEQTGARITDESISHDDIIIRIAIGNNYSVGISGQPMAFPHP